MKYTDLLAYWKGELSDPNVTGFDWTPEEIAEQAIRQIVYGELSDLLEKHAEEVVALLETDDDGWRTDEFLNALVDA